MYAKILVISPLDTAWETGASVARSLGLDRRYKVWHERKANARLLEQADLVIPVLLGDGQEETAVLPLLGARPVLPVFSPQSCDRYQEQRPCQFDDFLVTPLREVELSYRVARILSRKSASSSREPGAYSPDLARMVGDAPAFAAAKQQVDLMARCDFPVLLVGETGTGKELCARAIHYSGRRTGKPFLPVNCGAIPPELFESELFGRHKGAYTGAWTSQTGLIAEAEKGTLFLDEIEALSMNGQAKLLRFLQDHTYYAVGSPALRQADIRVIAATNVELLAKVAEGTFREDLYYRLAVLRLVLPPVRQRRSDIPVLIEHFWRKHSGGPALPAIAADAMETLCAYNWPGNVRELENVVQHLLAMAAGPIITAKDLPIAAAAAADVPKSGSMRKAKAQMIERFERDFVAHLLTAHGGNVTRAAQEAQMDRRGFGRLVKKYHIDRKPESRLERSRLKPIPQAIGRE